MNRTDRLLAIVLELQRKGSRRAEDLAATFETSKRTIYRDIQALCESGVPVVAQAGVGYSLVEGYRMDDAEYALVGMGCVMETAKPTIDYMRSEMNLRVGAVNVCSYRPWPGPEVVDALTHVRAFTVMERMDDPLAPSNPLMRDIKTSFLDARLGLEEFRLAGVAADTFPVMLQCSAGLGSVAGSHWLGR